MAYCFGHFVYHGDVMQTSPILFESGKEYLSDRDTTVHSRWLTMRIFTAVLYNEDDTYVAECMEVGTVSQGNTIEESIKNLKEATELYLDEFSLKEVGKMLMTAFEVAVSAKAYESNRGKSGNCRPHAQRAKNRDAERSPEIGKSG